MRGPGDQEAKTGPCSLLESTIASLNVPFYDVTLSVTPAKVLEMARDAGIDYMWTDDRERQDLRTVTDMGKMTPSKFDTILGIGQYPVTVLDHANGMATFAADGLRAQAHFVSKVIEGDDVRLQRDAAEPGPAQDPQPAGDQRPRLRAEPGQRRQADGSGWQTAGKTGTWEYSTSRNENAHAWMVGYTKKLAAAVWVGNRAEEKAIADKNGARSGARASRPRSGGSS